MKNIFSLLAAFIIIISCAFSCDKDDDVRPKCAHHKHHRGCTCHHHHHHHGGCDKDSTNQQPN